jgi:hypothetical protein
MLTEPKKKKKKNHQWLGGGIFDVTKTTGAE